MIRTFPTFRLASTKKIISPIKKKLSALNRRNTWLFSSQRVIQLERTNRISTQINNFFQILHHLLYNMNGRESRNNVKIMRNTIGNPIFTTSISQKRLFSP